MAVAVLEAMRGYQKGDKSFSAFDVTKKIREEVAQGELSLLDAEKVDIGGADVVDVPHGIVRLLVREFIDSGLFEVARTATMTNSQGAAFTVYFPSTSNPFRAQPVYPAPANILAPPQPQAHSQAAKKPKYRDMSIAEKTAVQDWIIAFIGRKRAKNEAVTLKSCQGSLKKLVRMKAVDVESFLVGKGFTVTRQDGLPYHESLIHAAT